MRTVLGAAGVAGAAATAGWFLLAKVQGDSEMGFGPSTVIGTADGSVHAEIELVNRGREAGVIRKVEGTLVDGPPARVLVTRKGSKPPQRGWWESNILRPGETCVAEIDVELVAPGTGPVIVALDIHEIGRRLLAHRRTRLTLPIGVPAATS
ncbi:MAG: hypothetical protein M3203_12365 [Actinomycetota bacterium]|nr:hypothetical protein [Actinomycetota bacterium]